VGIELELVDRRTILLNDDAWRWIAVKRFRQDRPSEHPESDVLPALLSNPSYVDDHASPDGRTYAFAEGSTAEPIHGRYRLDALSPDLFDLVSPDHASAVLTGWLEQEGPFNSEPVEGDLDEVFDLLRQSPMIFQLRTLGDEALHDWGWVVGKQGFHELVVVEPEGGVVVIVAGHD